MRLINVKTFELESFSGSESDIPTYSILSHTWTSDELVYDDLRNGASKLLIRSRRFDKIREACYQARRDGYAYMWVDTCCIDKTSSTELSEAINSMFKYYSQSAVCYVYLDDFAVGIKKRNKDSGELELETWDTRFEKARWFTRGWTLQELIAPRNVRFFDKDWEDIGTRNGGLLERICTRTSIPREIFIELRCSPSCPGGQNTREGICKACRWADTLPMFLTGFPASIKMSWAANRLTTRKEDVAYSLLGLFGLTMPMQYGEGTHAYMRLQENILRQTRDQTLLLWKMPVGMNTNVGCLATSPTFFQKPLPLPARRHPAHIRRTHAGPAASFGGDLAMMEVTNRSVRMSLWCCRCTFRTYRPIPLAPLEHEYWMGICDYGVHTDYMVRPAILLTGLASSTLFRRVHPGVVVLVDTRFKVSTITLWPDGSLDSNGKLLPKVAPGPIYTVTRDISTTTRKDIEVFLYYAPGVFGPAPKQSNIPVAGPLFERAVSGLPGVDSIVNRIKGYHYPPVLASRNAMTYLPDRWVFSLCNRESLKLAVGGIHFVELHSNKFTAPPTAVIIWGVHARSGTNVWRPWNKVLSPENFWNAFTDPSSKYANLFGELKIQIEAGQATGGGDVALGQLMALRDSLADDCYEGIEVVVERGREPLFPVFFHEDWNRNTIKGFKDDEGRDFGLKLSTLRMHSMGRTTYTHSWTVIRPEDKLWELKPPLADAISPSEASSVRTPSPSRSSEDWGATSTAGTSAPPSPAPSTGGFDRNGESPIGTGFPSGLSCHDVGRARKHSSPYSTLDNAALTPEDEYLDGTPSHGDLEAVGKEKGDQGIHLAIASTTTQEVPTIHVQEITTVGKEAVASSPGHEQAVHDRSQACTELSTNDALRYEARIAELETQVSSMKALEAKLAALQPIEDQLLAMKALEKKLSAMMTGLQEKHGP